MHLFEVKELNVITHSSRLTLQWKFNSSARLAPSNLFSVQFDLSTNPVAACTWSSPWNSFISRFLENSMEALLLKIWSCFSYWYELFSQHREKWFFFNSKTWTRFRFGFGSSFGGRSFTKILYGIKNLWVPHFFSWEFFLISSYYSFPISFEFFAFLLSLFGDCVCKFLVAFMEAVPFFPFISTLFRVPGHQKMLAICRISVCPGCLKNKVS